MARTADETISISHLRDHMKEVLESASQGARFRVLQNSNELAVVIGATEWAMLCETLDVMLDKDMVKQITDSEEAIERGDVQDFDEAWDEIEKELDED